MRIYVNGEIYPDNAAVISVNDHGFLYGAGLFETFRAYAGHLFLFHDHYQRLSEAASHFHMTMPLSEHGLKEAVLETMKANQLSDAYIRITLTAGSEGVGLTAEPYQRPTLVIHCKPLSPVKVGAGEFPLLKRLISLPFMHKIPGGIGCFKTLNYLPHVMAKKMTGGDPQAEGIFFTPEGYVAEGIVSNLFFIKDEKVYTPHLQTGILPGITRRMVLALAAKYGIQADEGFYPLEKWKEADEIFVTNSIQEIVPVHDVDGYTLGQQAVPGPVTLFLREKFHLYVTILEAVENIE